MGKYMRKAKVTGEVSVVMDMAPQSTLGVRTRAKTLALQRLDTTNPSSDPAASYLQLRSRRLEKPPPNLKPTTPRHASGEKKMCGAVRDVDEVSREELKDSEGGVEVSFGDNVLELEQRDRYSRETTPCSLILNSDTIRTPGSTTRRSKSNGVNRTTVGMNITATHEMDEFFAGAEHLQQRLFLEKYNYDLVNDCPLPGRYEWVRLGS